MKHRKEKQWNYKQAPWTTFYASQTKPSIGNLQHLCTFWLMGVHIYCKLYHIQTFKAVSEISKFLAKISLDSHFVCVQWQKRERVKRSKVRAWSKLHWKCRRKSMATGLDITELAKKRNAQHTTPLDVQTASKITKAYNKVFSLLFPFSICFSAFFPLSFRPFNINSIEFYAKISRYGNRKPIMRKVVNRCEWFSRGIIATNLQVNGNFLSIKLVLVKTISRDTADIIICQSMQYRNSNLLSPPIICIHSMEWCTVWLALPLRNNWNSLSLSSSPAIV